MSQPSSAVPPKLQAWIQARKRNRLSHAQVQMARELGMNPTRIDRQPPTRALEGALPEFIERLHFKRFGRERPEIVVSIDKRARQRQQKKPDRKAEKAGRRPDTSITGDAP